MKHRKYKCFVSRERAVLPGRQPGDVTTESRANGRAKYSRLYIHAHVLAWAANGLARGGGLECWSAEIGWLAARHTQHGKQGAQGRQAGVDGAGARSFQRCGLASVHVL